MALTSDEILRCKNLTGYNVVNVGAEAYALEGYVALFDRAIQPYLVDVATTSSTAVVAASPSAVVALTLASNPAVAGNITQPLSFTQGSNVVVDVGPFAEESVILFISGLVASCTLSLAHGVLGAYPIKARGAEQFVRDIFARHDAIDAQLTGTAPVTAGIQKTAEAQFYASETGRRATTKDRFGSLIEQRTQARRDLALLLGIPYLPDFRKRGSGATEPY